MKTKIFILFAIISIFLSEFAVVHAQIPDVNPVYIVQSGDTLTSIALKFGISLEQLIAINPSSNPNALKIGSKLAIPGFTGVTGILSAKAVPFGETFRTLLVKSQISPAIFLKLNRFTSPEEIFAGINLILPDNSQSTGLSSKNTLSNGQSLLEIEVQNNLPKWNITIANLSSQTELALPGEPIFFSSSKSELESTSISPLVKSIEVNPLPLIQGKTITIRIISKASITLSGVLLGNKLNFFKESENQYVAMQGVHALAESGLSALSLTIADSKGVSSTLEENLLLRAGGYIKDPPLTVDPNTLDPKVTKPEEDQVKEIMGKISPTKLWTGTFRLPVDEPMCLQSTFGNRRSYNNSAFSYFHSGVDFGVCKSLNIFAPANGIVVFAGPLTVRGNATIIDHGWGVFSGYWHQSQLKVKIGDSVKAGQLIGLVGGTGRVTGPHLHWEMIVNGIQVEPLDWLEQNYP